MPERSNTKNPKLLGMVASSVISASDESAGCGLCDMGNYRQTGVRDKNGGLAYPESLRKQMGNWMTVTCTVVYALFAGECR